MEKILDKLEKLKKLAAPKSKSNASAQNAAQKATE